MSFIVGEITEYRAGYWSYLALMYAASLKIVPNSSKYILYAGGWDGLIPER